MLKPIKTFYSSTIPTLEVFEEVRQIAIQEDCVIELRYCPHILSGWYYEYVFSDSDPAELAQRVPDTFGI